MQGLSKCVGRYARLSKLIFQNFSRMYGAHAVHGNFLSVIICNFCVVRPVFPPLKADSPLFVNADALLPDSIATQRLKTITGKFHQVFNAGGAFKNLQSLLCLPGKGLKTRNTPAVVEFFSMLAGKGSDHGYYTKVLYVLRQASSLADEPLEPGKINASRKQRSARRR